MFGVALKDLMLAMYSIYTLPASEHEDYQSTMESVQEYFSCSVAFCLQRLCVKVNCQANICHIALLLEVVWQSPFKEVAMSETIKLIVEGLNNRPIIVQSFIILFCVFLPLCHQRPLKGYRRKHLVDIAQIPEEFVVTCNVADHKIS